MGWFEDEGRRAIEEIERRTGVRVEAEDVQRLRDWANPDDPNWQEDVARHVQAVAEKQERRAAPTGHRTEDSQGPGGVGERQQSAGRDPRTEAGYRPPRDPALARALARPWRYIPGTAARPGVTGDARSLLSQGQAADPRTAAEPTEADVQTFGEMAPVAARIRQMYQQFIGRDPSPDEIRGHLEGLPRSSLGAGDWEQRLRHSFMSASEYQQSQPQKVVELYQKWLGRTPTNEEIQSHAGNVHGVAGIEYALANSPEYTQRIAGIFDERGQPKPGWTRTATGYQFTPTPGTPGTPGRWEQGAAPPGGGPGPGGTPGPGPGPNRMSWLTRGGDDGQGWGGASEGEWSDGQWFGASPPQVPYTPFTEEFRPSVAMPSDLMDPWTRTFTAPTAEDVAKSPAYRFRVKEALEALERSAAARGSYLTPNTMRALQEASQGLASQEYGAEFGRQRGTYEGDFNIFAADKARRGNTYFNQYDRDADQFGRRYDIFRNNQLDPFGMGIQTRQENRADRGLDFSIDTGLWQRGFDERGQDFSMNDITRRFDFDRDRDAWMRSRTSYRDVMDDLYRNAELGTRRPPR